jgi:ribosomal protein S18 acetylase RimI-like enzyme
MSNPSTIRMGTPEDADTLASFNVKLARESEEIILDPETVTKGVHALMEHPQYGFYVVAERDGIIMGSLMITYEWSDWRNGVIWWVQSVYVRPEYRRQGILKNLFTFIREKARQQGNVCGFRLYVEENNHNALAGYERVGMKKTGYYMYEDLFKNSQI